MGPFAPLRVRGGGADRLRRLVRRQRRAAAAGLALAGAALATTGLGGGAAGQTAAPEAPPGSDRPSVRLVSAPVRIADAATVRLLRPGDRVDVIAVGAAADDEARVVARGVRVAEVPDSGPEGGAGGPEPGALVLLSVERSTATALLGAGTSGRLAVAVSDAN
ncbi:RcpC/CpaB family pilus assembly protein [Streptomyces sp. NPDC101181]|uniref:RcpC/CpaB family pilus assembly protein n=1 Tax=Streptomyces sp. NPDC101181 TaxID=3366125 RepID=UPI003804BF37